MSLVRKFHCESSLSVRLAPPGPEAHDGRPAKATPGVGAAAGRPEGRGGPDLRSSVHRLAGPCEAASRSESTTAAPNAERGPYRTTCENPAALLRRATVPRTQPSVGQLNSTARPTRAGPDKTSAGAASRNPVGATRGEGSPAALAGGAAGWFAAARRVVRRRGAAASYSATFSGQCDSSSTRSHSSSDDACPRHRTR